MATEEFHSVVITVFFVANGDEKALSALTVHRLINKLLYHNNAGTDIWEKRALGYSNVYANNNTHNLKI